MALRAEPPRPIGRHWGSSRAGSMLLVARPADEVLGPAQGRWTWADLAAPPDDGRRHEIIDGVLYVTPPPTLEHEASAASIIHFLYAHVVLNGLGVVFGSNTGVRLAPDGVVMPDAVVVLTPNLARLTPGAVVGSPALVVEIASPGTAEYNRREKLDAYARAGVPEYWIADPAQSTVEVLCREGGRYQSLGVFQGAATLPSRVLPGFPTPVEPLCPSLPGIAPE